jgi:hypothetical protein
MTAMETGVVVAATVTVAVVAAGNSRGRQQSTTSGSIVEKTAAAVAMAAAVAATVATGAADNSRTGGQIAPMLYMESNLTDFFLSHFSVKNLLVHSKKFLPMLHGLIRM